MSGTMKSKSPKNKEKGASKYKEKEITETLDVLVFNYKKKYDRSFKINSMIIFNHDKFLNGNPRPWSQEIKSTIKNTLKKLRFQGVIHDNLTKRNLIEAVKIFAQNNFSAYGCVCVAILTHGHDKPGFIRSENRWYNECEVFEHFDVAKNPTLAGKPIIFLIQASRGADAMATVVPKRASKPDADLEKNIDYQLPLDATRVVFHNAYTDGGCVSGSWLTQTLCEKIDSCSSEVGLLELFRKVRGSAKWIQESMDWKQTLTFTSTLTRHIYLENKKLDELSSPYDGKEIYFRDNVENDSTCNGPAWTSQDSKDNCSPQTEEPNLTYTGTLEETPIHLYPDTYQLETFRKNVMVIFNHENFSHSPLDARTGTQYDVNALKDTFERFQFDVTVHNDLKKKELLLELQKFGKQDFTDYGCICVTILTHGYDHGVLLAHDKDYREREVFACFNTVMNRSLVAKPLIFLIQACRGPSLASTVQVNNLERSSSVELDANKRKVGAYCLPTEADMVIFHSSFFGKASVRETCKGTWFIQTICAQLNLYAGKEREHLEEIFRRVRMEIALQKAHQGGKQMPVVTSTLLRKLYFVEKNRGYIQ